MTLPQIVFLVSTSVTKNGLGAEMLMLQNPTYVYSEVVQLNLGEAYIRFLP